MKEQQEAPSLPHENHNISSEQGKKRDIPHSPGMLRQAVEDAYYVHNYSITTGKNIPLDVSTVIIECQRLLERHQEGEITTEMEVKFSDAYRKLAALMLPVTVESLRDTEDVQSDPYRPFLKKLRFSRVKQISILLPVLAITFILLILGSEIVQSIFLSGLQDIAAKEAQMEQLSAELDEVANQLVPLANIEKQMTLQITKSRGLASEKLPPQQMEVLDQKDQLVAQLEDKKNRLSDRILELENDILAQLKNLKAIWDKLPIHPSFFREKEQQEEWLFDPNQTILIKTEFSIITQVLNRLLPILYGALGSTAYFLRVLIPHIRDRTFTRKHSGSISVRICLGMLSGIAIQWFFVSPTQLERTLSTSALAFLAGYSVDLLFSMMDRFMMGFKSLERSSSGSLKSQQEEC